MARVVVVVGGLVGEEVAVEASVAAGVVVVSITC